MFVSMWISSKVDQDKDSNAGGLCSRYRGTIRETRECGQYKLNHLSHGVTKAYICKESPQNACISLEGWGSWCIYTSTCFTNWLMVLIPQHSQPSVNGQSSLLEKVLKRRDAYTGSWVMSGELNEHLKLRVTQGLEDNNFQDTILNYGRWFPCNLKWPLKWSHQMCSSQPVTLQIYWSKRELHHFLKAI